MLGFDAFTADRFIALLANLTKELLGDEGR